MIVNEGQLSDMLSSLPNFIDLANANEIRKIFVALCTHYDMKTPEDNIMLQSLILQLVYKLNHYASSSKTKYNPKRNNQNTINRMINYIHENLTSDLSLKTLSESANYSPIYFHRLFKASTGKTLREYVEEQRIKKAIELLLSTEMTLTQIAYACGFSSQSYFSYAFKKKMKCTPREYTNAIHLKYESNNTFE